MKTEYCWFLLGITGLLSQLGGTCCKSYRREFVSLAMAGTWIMFQGFTWNVLLFAVSQDIAFRMPFTKFGDSIPNDWRNWLWLPLWGVFICGQVLILNWHVWPATMICGALLALLGVLSNIKATARFFQWKMVEMAEGLLPAVVLCYAITL